MEMGLWAVGESRSSGRIKLIYRIHFDFYVIFYLFILLSFRVLMQTRFKERTNSMNGRGKRSLEGGDDEDQKPARKIPALAR